MYKVLCNTLIYVNLIGDRSSEKTFWFTEFRIFSKSASVQFFRVSTVTPNRLGVVGCCENGI